MQVGDLVKRKPEWGDWVKHNPWMLSEKDLEIGLIVQIGRPSDRLRLVNWPNDGPKWENKKDLEKVDGNKDRGCSSTEKSS